MSPVISPNEVRTRLSAIQRANEHGPPGPNVPFPVVRVQAPNERSKSSRSSDISIVQNLVWVGGTSGGIMGFNIGMLSASFAGKSLLFVVSPGVACMVGIAIGASIARQFALSKRPDLQVILRT